MSVLRILCPGQFIDLVLECRGESHSGWQVKAQASGNDDVVIHLSRVCAGAEPSHPQRDVEDVGRVTDHENTVGKNDGLVVGVGEQFGLGHIDFSQLTAGEWADAARLVESSKQEGQAA